MPPSLPATRTPERSDARSREQTTPIHSRPPDDRRFSPFLRVEDVAIRLHCSIRTVHELTRLARIPHRRLPGSRRCLFREDELRVWEDGTQLELIELRGGRIVRPKRM